LNGAWGIASGALTLLGVVVTSWLTYRGARSAAAAQAAQAQAAAAPAAKAQDFAVLQATVERVDKENGMSRERQSRLEALLRAFAWTADRWARQMERAGITPEPPHPLVDEYNRTGVRPVTEPPAERQPRRDDTAADAGSLERMGRIDPQPIPEPSISPFLEPDPPPPPVEE
jgi:hypothetical protein